jgi:hypothetical protein
MVYLTASKNQLTKPIRSQALKQAQQRYRDKTRDRYNEYQREMVRKLYDPEKRHRLYYEPIKNDLDAYRQVRKLFI